MKVIFTCGGTAGHVNPALALAGYMRQQDPKARFLFVGTPDGMERDLVEKAGYPFRGIPMGGFQRSLGHGGLGHNLNSLAMLARSRSRARAILRDFRPDLVVGTGGYASFPALYAAQSMGIPTCVHESNAVPGVTTRLAANKASRVLVAFEESVRHYRHPEKVEVVGMPVRREFIFDTKEGARKELGLSGFVVVSAFGSQGAKVMNETIADMMPLEQADGFPFHHIHATGSFGKEWMPKRVMDNGVDWKNCPALDIREYIYDMPTVMAAADIVIGRAGSATCNEIGASGTPCILIPSPNVTNNHQEKNARVLEAAGGAVVVLEKDCTPGKLYELIRSLLADEDRRREMSRKLHTMVRLDSAERICDIVEQLTQSEK